MEGGESRDNIGTQEKVDVFTSSLKVQPFCKGLTFFRRCDGKPLLPQHQLPPNNTPDTHQHPGGKQVLVGIRKSLPSPVPSRWILPRSGFLSLNPCLSTVKIYWQFYFSLLSYFQLYFVCRCINTNSQNHDSSSKGIKKLPPNQGIFITESWGFWCERLNVQRHQRHLGGDHHCCISRWSNQASLPVPLELWPTPFPSCPDTSFTPSSLAVRPEDEKRPPASTPHSPPGMSPSLLQAQV